MIRRLALALATSVLASGCALVGLSPDCDGTEVIAEFRQVGDLVKNANVQSSDVEIGLVNNIELDGWLAEVHMCIDEGERIPKDARAVIRTTSLLGEKFVDLQVDDREGPYLTDGDVISVENTGKATELEDVFARLGTVLGTGNLEDINRFTRSQAKILREHSGDLREVLRRLRDFTGTLATRRGQIASSIDTLDEVARTILADSGTVESFLETFAQSSTVLAQQKESLSDLLVSLDRFSNVSLQLLNATESGLQEQFRDLRPVLRTLVENSADLEDTLTTLATFSEMWPETMPGDYLQLDVCQAGPEHYTQGVTCPQSDQRDDPGTGTGTDGKGSGGGFFDYDDSVDRLIGQPLRGQG